MKVFVPRPTMTEQTMCSSLYKQFAYYIQEY